MLWLIDVTRRVIGPDYSAWVYQRLESRVRATVLSLSSQVDAVGQIIDRPIFGLIGKRLYVQAAITVSGLVLAPVLALYARAIRRPAIEPKKVVSLE